MNVLQDADHWRMKTTIDDSGYTKMCNVCYQRHGENHLMVGAERAIKMERCDDCVAHNRRAILE